MHSLSVAPPLPLMPKPCKSLPSTQFPHPARVNLLRKGPPLLLCRQCNAARFLHENLRIKKLWTPENVYSIVGSAYNPNARSEAVSAVRAHGNGPLAQGGLSNEAECAEMQAQIGRLDQVLRACLC